MKRTRKWEYVAQEATRLANLGLSPLEIAKRLDVKRSTVQRWMQQGKITDTRRGAARSGGVTEPSTPGEWGKQVRSSYALDATDEELVRMGEAAIATAHDTSESWPVRLSAMGRFQAIVKQLALVTRNADQEPVETPKPPAPPVRPIRRPGEDPRQLLMAVR